ncbi:ABC transporter permease [Algiphilus sp.]|uniref:ABC transporter permease n=1 Tax=Algiphilus sp. TaxID=1872431 RepID=UPI001CA6EB6C|nr:ABC transporter permease [Algiphilus sp.]MBY8966926.1 ABC transporter permease [Algiphilus acroporae]MCI5063082.1 ABC transporter permease [Algiphilus sp.]MCI5103576.1 ABC transporter permease [Algiphilus sp.]MCR9092014.1 ABC transporter permease [Pseudomonadota bacterium]
MTDVEAPTQSSGLWSRAWRRLRRDRAGMAALLVVATYFAVACTVWLGLAGQGWSALGADSFAPASAEHWFGTTRNGQDIFARTIYSTRVAFEIGLVVAISSTLLGALFGALSGYFAGSWIDETILWVKGTLDAIPFFLFVVAVAYAVQGHPLAMHFAMIVTFWTTTGRYVRGEVIKLRNMEFVEAARAVGVSQASIIFRHVLPNTTHILLVQATIVFVTAIKAEVILSFLGLGVQDGVSWGLMISQSTNEVTAGFFNNFIAASVAMFMLVMAFNFFADALQDALDPRKVEEAS